MREVKRVRTKAELEQARILRREIFVREQGIPAELDDDGLDDVADHVLVLIGGRAVATGRLVVEDDRSGLLARIAVRSEIRGQGLGKLVVRELERIAHERRLHTLTLHPHRYLERFYGDLGYATIPGTGTVGGHELITMRKRLTRETGEA
jgi:predicted GNAT family N-acyltransferase